MSEEEYYSRMEKIEGKLSTDRCSFDEVHNLNIQQNYLKTQYIKTLEQEKQQLKEQLKDENNYHNEAVKWYKEAFEREQERIKYRNALDEIREYIKEREPRVRIYGQATFNIDDLLQILDKVKE